MIERLEKQLDELETLLKALQLGKPTPVKPKTSQTPQPIAGATRTPRGVGSYNTSGITPPKKNGISNASKKDINYVAGHADASSPDKVAERLKAASAPTAMTSAKGSKLQIGHKMQTAAELISFNQGGQWNLKPKIPK